LGSVLPGRRLTAVLHQGRFDVTVLIGMLLGTLVGFVAVRMIQAFELQTIKDRIATPVAAHLIDHVTTKPIALPLPAIFLAGTGIGFIILAVAVVLLIALAWFARQLWSPIPS
jgi:hypothetical protein